MDSNPAGLRDAETIPYDQSAKVPASANAPRLVAGYFILNYRLTALLGAKKAALADRVFGLPRPHHRQRETTTGEEPLFFS